MHDDYVIRAIQQLATFLARIAWHREQGEHAKAMAEVGDAWTHVLLVELSRTA